MGPDNVVWRCSLLLLMTILFYEFHVPFNVDANQAVSVTLRTDLYFSWSGQGGIV